MTAGLELINNSGTVLINAENPNLAFRAKGSLTGSGTFTITGINCPVVGINCTGGRAGITAISTSGTSKTYTVTASSGSVVTEWYHFDLLTAPSSGPGLQLFNASGQLTFDSSAKILRVVNAEWVWNYAADPNGGGSQIFDTKVYSYSNARKYIVAFDAPPSFDEYEETNYGGYQWRYRYGNTAAVQMEPSGSNTKITINSLKGFSEGWTPWSTPPTDFVDPPNGGFYFGFSVMVIDVTGY